MVYLRNFDEFCLHEDLFFFEAIHVLLLQFLLKVNHAHCRRDEKSSNIVESLRTKSQISFATVLIFFFKIC